MRQSKDALLDHEWLEKVNFSLFCDGLFATKVDVFAVHPVVLQRNYVPNVLWDQELP